MRKCRKMISLIMLMVMLATLTPYQALAAEAPTGSTSETAAVVEPTQETDTEEAVNEVEAVEEETADAEQNTEEEETVTAEAASEGTSVSGAKEEAETEATEEKDAEEETAEAASTNEVAEVEEPVDENEDIGEDSAEATTEEAAAGETSMEIAPVVEPVEKEAMEAGGDLQTYVEGRGGKFVVTIYENKGTIASPEWEQVYTNANTNEGFTITDTSKPYKIVTSIICDKGIANGSYTHTFDIDGLDLSLYGDSKVTPGSMDVTDDSGNTRNFGTYALNGTTVTSQFKNANDLQGIRIQQYFQFNFEKVPNETYNILGAEVTINVPEPADPLPKVKKTGSLDKDNRTVTWTVNIDTSNGSDASGRTITDYLSTQGDYGDHEFVQDYGVEVTATNSKDKTQTVTWNAATDDSANFKWVNKEKFTYKIPAAWGGYTFGPYWNFKLVCKTYVTKTPLEEGQRRYYYNTITNVYDGSKTGGNVLWGVGVSGTKSAKVNDDYDTVTWNIKATYKDVSEDEIVDLKDATFGLIGTKDYTLNSEYEPAPKNYKVTLTYYEGSTKKTVTVGTSPTSESNGFYYTIETGKTYWSNPRGWKLILHREGYEGSGFNATSDKQAILNVSYDTDFTDDFIAILKEEGYTGWENAVAFYIDGTWAGNDFASVDIPGKINKDIVVKATEKTGFRATFKLEFQPTEKKEELGNLQQITLTDEMSNTLFIFQDTIKVVAKNKAGQEMPVSWTHEYNNKVLKIYIKNPKRYFYTVTYDCQVALTVEDYVKYSNKFYVEDKEDWYSEKSDIISDFQAIAETYKVTLVKVDESGSPLKGAEIGLFTALGNKIKSEETGDDGMTSFITDIENDVYYEMNTPYYLQEITAPEGYVLDNTKKWFVFIDSAKDVDGNSEESYWVKYFADNGVAASNYQIVDANKKSVGEGTSTYSSFETETFELVNVPEDINLTVNKKWDDLNNVDNTRPTSIKVQLYADGKKEGKEVEIKPDKNGNFTYTWTDLKKNNTDGTAIKYTVTETQVTGYQAPVIGQTKEVKDKDGNVTGYTIEITNSLTPTTEVSVEKVWDDFDDEAKKRPTSITVQLLADDKVVEGSQITLDGTVDENEKIAWKYTWTGLDKYAADGKTAIVYSVDEVSVPNGYTKTITGDATTGYTIKNSYMPKVNISVEKIWDDSNDQDKLRPESIEVKLTANGVAKGSNITLDESNQWKYTWPNLDKYDSTTKAAITYKVDEVSVPAKYEKTVSGNATTGFKIKNTHGKETTEVSVEKVWDDFDDEAKKRPASITVQLLANNTVVEGSQVTLDGTVDDKETTAWNYTWTGLDKNKAGTAINYTVDEVSVPNGYTKTITADEDTTADVGYIIKNSYMPKVNISVEKVWDDKNNQDGKRPATITVYLTKNGTKVENSKAILGKVEVDGEEKEVWTHTWSNLPVYESGKKITYSVTEDEITDYTASDPVVKEVKDNTTYYTLTNKYEPGKVSAKVTKTWDDNNNQDGLRKSIEVQLMKDGVSMGDTYKATLSKDNSWTKTWTGLDEMNAGKPIEYTVAEISKITGYTTEGPKAVYNAKTKTWEISITNKHTPKTTKVNVTKVWDDNDDQDGLRTSVEVQLMKDGVSMGDSYKTTLKEGSWTYTWENLPMNKDEGTPIVYSVTEGVITGYNGDKAAEPVKKKTETGKDGIVTVYYELTNKHTPETIKLYVEKEWDDAGNQDGKRPEKIYVCLTDDGNKIAGTEAELSEAKGWNYTWKDLPKYKNKGTKINYDVIEYVKVGTDTVAIDGYTAEKTAISEDKLPDGVEAGYAYHIKNTYAPDKRNISVKKVWDDENNKDNRRPAEITVQLLADGKVVDGSQITLDGEVDDNEKEAWNYTWKDLNKYRDQGIEIQYTVDEVEITATKENKKDYEPIGYYKAVTGDMTGYTITNTHEEKPVSISKTDITGENEVAGATLQILENGKVVTAKDKDGNDFEAQWVSTDTAQEVYGLTPGTVYTLRETIEPKGYTIAADTTFKIIVDGDNNLVGVETNGTQVEGNHILVKDAPTYVKVRKVDVDNNEKEVAGATLQILTKDEEGNETVVEQWESKEGEDHEVTGLIAGVEYTLRETVPAPRYTITSDTKFTVNNKNEVTSEGKVSKTEDGTPVLLVEDKITEVEVSKKAITGEKELKGAHIQILTKDEEGNESIATDENGDNCEWDSTDKPHVVRGLKTGVDYILRETVAPDGFTITSDATFSIDENNKVTYNGKEIEGNVLLIEDEPTKVKVSKTDITGEKELQGATLQILDAEDNVVEIKDNDGKVVETCEWKSTKEPKYIEGLKTEVVYTLRETIAPDGYTIATDIQFTIATDGKVTCTGKTTEAEDGTTVIVVNDDITKVKISKTDIANSEELPGATLQVLDSEGKVVEIKDNDGNVLDTLEWVSSTEPKYIEGLPTGVEYTLRETVAPDGYTITSDTKFSIDTEGKVTSSGTTSVDENGVTILVVEDSLTKITVSKVDTGAGEELPGAKIQIIDEDGNVVEEWTSTTEPHEIEGLLTGVKYILREKVAPLGYTLTSDTTFTIDEYGNVTSTGTVNHEGMLVIEDTITTVSILKIDAKTGKGLKGAVLQVLDDNGTVCEEWTSTTEAHVVTGLYTGVTYTLHEASAPKGYDKTKDITFVIDEYGKIKSDALQDGVIVMKDTPTPPKDKTGDEANGTLWALLLALAGSALGGTIWFRRKRRI